MAEAIVTPKKTHTYHLPTADRQAIISRSDSWATSKKIEIQRQNFIKKNGNDGVSVGA